MEFIKNIYRSKNEEQVGPTVAMKELKDYTVALLKKTEPNLSEEEVQGFTNRLIFQASQELEKQNKQEAQKRYLFKKLSSSTDSKNSTPTSSPPASRRPVYLSGSPYGTPTTRSINSISNSGSSGRSGIPSSPVSKTKTPKSISKQEEMESSVDATTPTFRSLPAGRSSIPRLLKTSSGKKLEAMDKMKLVPRNLCSTMDKNVLAKRKIALLSGRLNFTSVIQSGVGKNCAEDSSDSESETIV